MEILLAIEERLKAHDFAERVKLAVISADPTHWIRKMFPQWFASEKPSASGAEPVVVTDIDDLSDTTGTWIFPDEKVTPEQVMRELAEAGQMSAGIADLGEWSEWRE